MREVFRYQIWHFLALLLLLVAVNFLVHRVPRIATGSLWGVSTWYWLWLAVAVPIAHQIYVWLIWRLELYHNTFTSRWGMRSFQVYAAGFSILFAGRLIAIILLALSNRDTLDVPPFVAWVIAGFITPPVIYLFYSVKRYFTIKRAYGIDHFDKEYNEPYVKRGIFRFTDNGMYIYGLMILYLPGLLLQSKAALVVAIFNHLYIWVHYYFTERPDMEKIYGKAP